MKDDKLDTKKNDFVNTATRNSGRCNFNIQSSKTKPYKTENVIKTTNKEKN